MAKQVINSASNKIPFTQQELEYIDYVRCNPALPDFVELYLAGVI